MKRRNKKCLGLLLASIMLVLQTACSMVILEEPSYYESKPEADKRVEVQSAAQSAEVQSAQSAETQSVADTVSTNLLADHLPVEGNSYYDLENVVLYLYLYEELPDNYMTKAEARELGWEGGSVEKYKEGAAIGGDTFGNREGLLPKEKGRTYTECDIDTDGEKSRGAKRLVFSSDGLYFYTEDHYESFDEVIVMENYEVIW